MGFILFFLKLNIDFLIFFFKQSGLLVYQFHTFWLSTNECIGFTNLKKFAGGRRRGKQRRIKKKNICKRDFVHWKMISKKLVFQTILCQLVTFICKNKTHNSLDRIVENVECQKYFWICSTNQIAKKQNF